MICFVCEKEIEDGQPFQVLMSDEIIHSCTHNECWPEIKNKLSENDLKTLRLPSAEDSVS